MIGCLPRLLIKAQIADVNVRLHPRNRVKKQLNGNLIMRSDSEIKAKVVELLELEGEERSEMIQALDGLDVKALKKIKTEAHSVRGMLSALLWALGFTFSDIRTYVVEPSLQREAAYLEESES